MPVRRRTAGVAAATTSDLDLALEAREIRPIGFASVPIVKDQLMIDRIDHGGLLLQWKKNQGTLLEAPDSVSFRGR